MKTEHELTNELSLELKYGERCGGLRLRPVGSGQTFCVRCAGEMSEPPSRPRESSYAKPPRGHRQPFLHELDGSFEACGVEVDIAHNSVGGGM